MLVFKLMLYPCNGIMKAKRYILNKRKKGYPMNYSLIDTHCHITCDELYSHICEVLMNAKYHHVERMLIVCIDWKSFERAKELKQREDIFDIAMGFHPSDLYDFTEHDYERLEQVLANDEVVALGEIGLDYHWDTVKKEDQKKGFIRQIELANKYKKPILIHMRDATQDTLEILQEYAKTPFLMHCFSGSKETAKIIMRMGGYISFAGPITFKNANGLLEVPAVCDVHKIFVETDCPYLTPHPHRGKQNEPMYVQYTFEKVCELLGMDEKDLSEQMKRNYQELFHSKR